MATASYLESAKEAREKLEEELVAIQKKLADERAALDQKRDMVIPRVEELACQDEELTEEELKEMEDLERELERAERGFRESSTVNEGLIAKIEEDIKMIDEEIRRIDIEEKEVDDHIESLEKEVDESLTPEEVTKRIEEMRAQEKKARREAAAERKRREAEAERLKKENELIMDEIREGDTNKRELGLQVAIVMDCTRSMVRSLKGVKDKLVSVIEKLRQNPKNPIIEVAFVGYRDFGDVDPPVIDFTPDIQSLVEKVTNVGAQGGGDIPEDVTGGLEKAFHLSWSKSTRLIIHFADAPPHGPQYIDTTRFKAPRDDHPDGAPKGVERLGFERCIQRLAVKRISYFFVCLHPNCDRMSDIIGAGYKPYSGTTHFKKLVVTSPDDEFDSIITESVTAAQSLNVPFWSSVTPS